MISLILAAALSCPITVYEDHSGLGWTAHDNRIIKNNQNSCERKFGKEWKCMKRFIKREDRVYWITCSEPVE